MKTRNAERREGNKHQEKWTKDIGRLRRFEWVLEVSDSHFQWNRKTYLKD